jgi:hypothetical protein
MNNYTLSALFCFLLLAPALYAQTKTSADATKVVTSPPLVPEEARKHFVMGTTFFKDAKTADDFLQIEGEFKQATDLAPQWPEARYNLALAKEAAGDYSGAMADLKLYQQFKLSDSEARTVQDKIYALEAKAGLAAKKQAEERNVTAAEEQKKRDYQDKIGFLAGTWNASATSEYNSWEAKAVITVTDKNIVIAGVVTDSVTRGTVETDGSITWILTGERLPALPVEVTVNKSAHQINWKQPYVRHGKGGALSWDASAVAIIQLTK